MGSLIVRLPTELSTAPTAIAAATSPLILPMEQNTAPTLRNSRWRNTVTAMSQFEVVPCQTDEVLRGGAGASESESAELNDSVGDASSDHVPSEDVSVSRRFSNIDLRLEMWNLATGSSASTTKHQRTSPLGARPARSRSSPIIATPENASSLAPENTNISSAKYSAAETSGNALPSAEVAAARCHARPAQLEVAGSELLELSPATRRTLEAQEMRETRETLETRGSVPETAAAGFEVATSRRILSRWQSVPSLATLNSPVPRHASPRWPVLSEASQPGTISESVSPAAVSSYGRRFQTTNGVSDPVRVGTPPTSRPASAMVRGAKLSRAASSEPTSNVFVWAAQQRIARHRSALQ
ncbi:unnamed protein product [Closterium sp. NIES-54]